LLKACQRPRWLETLVAYDFSSPGACAASLAKLLEELGRSRDVITRVLADNARKGLAALAQLMSSDRVRPFVPLARDSLTSAQADIAELGRWKGLHERLHHAADLLPNLIEKKGEVMAAAEEMSEGEADGEARLDDAWLELENRFRGDF